MGWEIKGVTLDSDEIGGKKIEVDYSSLILDKSYKVKESQSDKEVKILKIETERNQQNVEFKCVMWRDPTTGLEYKYLADTFLETFERVQSVK